MSEPLDYEAAAIELQHHVRTTPLRKMDHKWLETVARQIVDAALGATDAKEGSE